MDACHYVMTRYDSCQFFLSFFKIASYMIPETVKKKGTRFI